MLHPKTALPSPALLALCWQAFGSVIYLFFSLGKWGKSAGFAFLARRCTEAPAEPSAWCLRPPQSWAWRVQGFLTVPGLVGLCKCDINLLEEESCSRSPAACSMCVKIPWLSPCPCLGLCPELISAFPAPALQLLCSRGPWPHFCFSGGINDGWKPILFTKKTSQIATGCLNSKWLQISS